MSAQIGNKPRTERAVFKNAESSALIPQGAPAILVINATDDGFAAVLPSTATASKSPNLFAGVCIEPLGLAANAAGMFVVGGFVQSAIIVQQSRATSTDSWATGAAFSTGQLLTIDTVNNAFATAVSTQKVVTNATTDTLALSLIGLGLPFAVLCGTLASAAGSASTSSDTRVAITYGLKVLLRSM